MSCKKISPLIKLDICDEDIVVTLTQYTDEQGTPPETIVMNSVQFSNTLYTLKAIEHQLLLDSQKPAVFSGGLSDNLVVSPVDRPKAPTPPENFGELFASMEGSDWILNQNVAMIEEVDNMPSERDDYLEAPVDGTAKKMEITDEIYDPINFHVSTSSVACEQNTNATAMSPHTERLYQLYHPTPVKNEYKPLLDESSVDKDSNSPKKIEKRVTMRKQYLEKYAKVICKRFWQFFEERCSDVKSNRAFLAKTLKEQIETLFDELHNSVSEQEFNENVGCPLDKDIFVSCNKTKARLINAVFKMANE